MNASCPGGHCQGHAFTDYHPREPEGLTLLTRRNLLKASLAGLAGLSVPGEGETRDNRLGGIGALSGIATGVAVGALFGGLRAFGLRSGPLLGTVLVGLSAMAATDSSMARLGVSDPRSWSAADWLSDLVPHLAYGAVVSTTLEALGQRQAH